MAQPDVKALLVGIGHNVRQLRESKGLTQAALAELCGVEPTHIQRVEYGTTSASLRLLASLAAALETEVWKLCKPTRIANPQRRPGRPRRG